MSSNSKIRLYVEDELKEGISLVLNEMQSHYLCNVMRLKSGSKISCFNEKCGEFSAFIGTIHKKQTSINLNAKIREAVKSPDVWLVFSPLKKDCMDFLVEKSVELGVSVLQPVITQYGITDKLRQDRIQTQMREAAEQCERLDTPVLRPVAKIEELLKQWDTSRRIFFFDERGKGRTCADAFSDKSASKAALLIGPEGGFSDSEAEMLYNLPFVTAVSLGPRILRAETAATAALSVWQALSGDWK